MGVFELLKSHLLMPKHWIPKPSRVHDRALMEYFLEQDLHHSIIDSINCCRIYLHVITITDITSADGTYILPEVRLGQRPAGRRSTLQWPYQGKPATSDWNAWRSSLLLLEHRGKLNIPLGDWLMQPHQV